MKIKRGRKGIRTNGSIRKAVVIQIIEKQAVAIRKKAINNDIDPDTKFTCKSVTFEKPRYCSGRDTKIEKGTGLCRSCGNHKCGESGFPSTKSSKKMKNFGPIRKSASTRGRKKFSRKDYSYLLEISKE